MRLVVISHKLCWSDPNSRTGYATDGGFPLQMNALSQLFESTVLVVPTSRDEGTSGLLPVTGKNLVVRPVSEPPGKNIWRKFGVLFWLLRDGAVVLRELRRADAVHVPIPGDVGAIGMLFAFFLRKPLFVRHCGNWFVQKTTAEHFLKWFMERFAGGRRVMLATGGANQPPSQRNSAIRWIFSTALTEEELHACRIPRVRPPEHVRLIIACRQEREKGTGIVVESLRILTKRFPSVCLDILGDGPALEEFKSLAASLGVADRVMFHGKVDHNTVIRFLQNAHLFCYPTAASEGFPKVVLEALACGLPVITTKVSVLPKLIGSGCGVLLPERTPKSLAEAIEHLLLNEGAYRRMSAQALETAKVYSLEHWRDTIGEVLKSEWGLVLSHV